MALTKYGIEAMGFTEIPSGTKLEVYFNSAILYHIEGIIINDLLPESIRDLIYKHSDFSFAFGNSINDIFKALFNEAFVENEDDWKKKNNANPPFFVVIFGIKDPLICESGYWKKEKESILTYDGFPKAKQSLKEVEQKIIPSLISSLTAKLSKIHYPIRFKLITRKVFGKTTEGENLSDIKLSMSAKGVTLINVSPAELKSKINESMNLYPMVHPKVASLFHSSIEDDDRFKQFLNLFQALEIHTHQTFKKIDFSVHLSKIHNVPNRIKKAGNDFFIMQESESKNLSQRFIWCAILVWDNLEDSDIEDFKKIKKVRDELAHGEKIPESSFPIEKAEKLLLKII